MAAEREDVMQNFKDQFYLNFIKDDRWQYLTNGLKTTLLITFFAVILGLVLGFLAAIVRSSAVRGGIKKPPHMKEKGVWLWKMAGYYLFKLVDLICQIYLANVTPTDAQKAAADVNGDGTADVSDALMVCQYYLGNITGFPAGKSK